MKIRAAILVALVGLGVGPANAQSRWADEPGYYAEGLPMRVIIRTVRLQGLLPVSRPVRRENVYVVEAVDEFDRPRRVLIDARSARVVAVQPSGRSGPGSHEGRGYVVRPHDRDYVVRPHDRDFTVQPEGRDLAVRPEGRDLAMRPPRVIPGDPGLPSRALPEGEGEDRLNVPAPNAAPQRLPPLRRPSGEQGAAVPAPSINEEVPPPPARRPPAQTTPRAAAPPRSAAVNPASPPAPRPRPAVTEPATTGSVPTTAPETNSAVPAKPKALPRVVLPGGPVPKAERTADRRPGQREPAGKTDGKTSATAPETPAAQPATPPASGGSGVPPAQTLE